MPMPLYSRRNLDFLMHEVFQIENLTQYPYFSAHSRESFDMVLDMSAEIADKILAPTFTEADRKYPELIDGVVKAHSAAGEYMQMMGKTGLASATFSEKHGGQQLPHSVAIMAAFIAGATNNGFGSYIGLTTGAANLIVSFGSEELIKKYALKMLACEWGGTMCLTEPQAGSSLSDITTTATLQADGSYKIKGQKIFISVGDHDQVANIVHLLLARIDGAAKGIKGISLFVVPKKRITENGKLEPNDVHSVGIFHKMGQKATPAMHLTFGDADNCMGWLVGEPHRGLSYMFQMMNSARLDVGTTGAYIASAAYYHSLQYAKERSQGRRLNNKDPHEPPTLIINHPDVRRLLFFQKAIVEASTSLIVECWRYYDLLHVVTTNEEREKYNMLLELLTPIAKTYPTEMGIQAVSAGMQVLGGYGFTEDFPLEQLYRDIRITTLYEGTTGIQSLDLLGRKVPAQQGKSLIFLAQEITATIAEANAFDNLRPYAKRLEEESKRLQKITTHLLGVATQGNAEYFLMDASLYMELFGLNTFAWQLLKQAVVAQKALISKEVHQADALFYESKIHTLKFYFHYEVPKTLGLEARLLDSEILTTVSEREMLL